MTNIGIIGAGYWGPKLIRNFSELNVLKMVADLDESRLAPIKEKHPELTFTNNHQDILNNPEIDAVVIATPVSTHFNLAKEALLANKHVLVEKPLTQTAEQAQELIDIANEKNKILMVDHTFEYTPEINKIKSLIDSGELGEIYSINIARLNLGRYQGDNMNVVTDLAPHDISIINYILSNKPNKIQAIGSCNVFQGVEDDAHIHLVFDNNITANLHVSWIYPKKVRTLAIIGSKKMLFYDGTDIQGETIKIYDKGIDFKNKGIAFGESFSDYIKALNYRYGDIHVPKIDGYEPLNKMCSHFIECIQQNKQPRSDGNSGLNVVKTLEAINSKLKENLA